MTRICIFAVLASLMAGCASRAPQVPPQPSSSIRPSPLVPGVASPATYVSRAASIDLLVIRSSELALVRSPSAQVRNVASGLIAAHQGTAAQLSFAGRRLNLLPGASMLPQQQAMYDELNASGDFDRTYVRLQRSVHGAALALHSDYARRGTSPTLRPVALNAQAVERSDLELLRRL